MYARAAGQLFLLTGGCDWVSVFGLIAEAPHLKELIMSLETPPPRVVAREKCRDDAALKQRHADVVFRK